MKTAKPVSQETLLDLLGVLFEEQGNIYQKCRQILARNAVPGEHITTITATGVETQNRANKGDYVVKNLTDSSEMYILPPQSFVERYAFVSDETDGWKRYKPLGKIIGIEVDNAVLDVLQRSSPFYIMAAWEEPQYVEKEDFLATPLSFHEVYRIGRNEFFQTYTLVET